MAEEIGTTDNERFPWNLGVFDAHCHPTETVPSLGLIPTMKTRVLNIMATCADDQSLVALTADKIGVQNKMTLKPGHWNDKERVVPCFGWHPWFSHQLYDENDHNVESLSSEAKIAHYTSVLHPKPKEIENGFILMLPDPHPLSAFLAQTRKYLLKYPGSFVGEIGLDKSFRIPEPLLGRNVDQKDILHAHEGHKYRFLSSFRVSMDHQMKIFKLQLDLAGELHRPVSVHGVQAHGYLFEAISEKWKNLEKPKLDRKGRRSHVDENCIKLEGKHEKSSAAQCSKSFPPRICLHSYSGHAATLKQYFKPSVPAEIYVSFSMAINFSEKQLVGQKNDEVIRAVPDDRILVESDLHAAGDTMDHAIEDVVRMICVSKQWDLVDGVKRLGQNWRRFVFGET